MAARHDAQSGMSIHIPSRILSARLRKGGSGTSEIVPRLWVDGESRSIMDTVYSDARARPAMRQMLVNAARASRGTGRPPSRPGASDSCW
jgi:hypothetical protein